jgi:hypothetical protein
MLIHQHHEDLAIPFSVRNIYIYIFIYIHLYTFKYMYHYKDDLDSHIAMDMITVSYVFIVYKILGYQYTKIMKI